MTGSGRDEGLAPRRGIDLGVAWRAGRTQLGLVVAVSLALAVALPSELFEKWGWLSGPIAWVTCAGLTARVLNASVPEMLGVALLAGGVSVPAVLIDLHWLGVVLAVVAFGLLAGIAARLKTRARNLEVEPLSTEDLALLERHKPVLVYDPQDDYRACSAEIAAVAHANVLRRFDGSVIASAESEPRLRLETLSSYPESSESDHLAFGPDRVGEARQLQRDPAYADRLYGRVVRGEARVWLQYWLWLYHNPKNLLGVGEHEGDWEMVQIGLGPDHLPEVATYSQHRAGEARSWSGVSHANGTERPLVYVAGLSHAAYFRPGPHPYGSGIDHAHEGPRVDDAQIEPFGEWALWPGHWGDVPAGVIGHLGAGPRGPGHQDKWSFPARFHLEARARTLSRALGWLARKLGAITAPRPPRLGVRRVEGELHVDYRIPFSTLRQARHLLITAHTPDARHVLASRIVRRVGLGPGSITLGALPPDAIVKASAFNRLRQRSDCVDATGHG